MGRAPAGPAMTLITAASTGAVLADAPREHQRVDASERHGVRADRLPRTVREDSHGERRPLVPGVRGSGYVPRVR
jgi:hypothetical protein